VGKLTHHEFIYFLTALSAMLVLSRLAAELGRLVKLPVVMGEIIIGIVLGPTILGHFSPHWHNLLFPVFGNVSIALDGITKLSVVMLLFVAGLEVQMQMVIKQGKAAVFTSFLGMVIPFAIGFAAAWYYPQFFKSGQDKFLYSLFFGTAMSISALPVIARILMDMNIFKTKIGMIIIASAMFDDLMGWLIFSLIMGLMGKGNDAHSVLLMMSYILGFGLFMLTIGKKIIDMSLPWIQKKFSWPGGVLSLSLGLCFICAAFTESIGLHAVLGAFIAGIAIGDSVKLNEKAREIIHQFVTNVFAPLFFVSIGLKLNFVTHFEFALVAAVLIIAIVGKVFGASLGAKLGGFTNRESLAIGFGLNARGAMEIILGTLALNAGLINEKMFVALVIMAIITSLFSAPFIKLFVKNHD
jgi:Kef-type K+ transport system membrane component KefB